MDNVADVRSEKTKNIWVYLYVLVMLIGFFLRSAFNVGIPVILFLILTVAAFLFFDDNGMLAVVASFIPLSAGFQYKYALLAFIAIYIFKKRATVRLNKVIILIIFMAIWELLHAFSGYFSFVEYLRGFSEIFLLIIIMSMDMRDVDHKLIYRTLSFSLIGLCFIMLYLQSVKLGQNIIDIFASSTYQYRFGGNNTESEFFGLNLNPNGLGFKCCLSVILMLILHVRKEQKWYDTVVLALAIMFGLATLSRTFIVCLIVTGVCFLFGLPKKFKHKAGFLFGVFSFILILFFFVNAYFPQIIENIILRFQADDVSNGRVDLMAFYNEHIFSSAEHMFFGIGLQDISQKISNIYGSFYDVSHNGFQEIWVCWGIVGMIAMISLLVSIIRCARKFESKPLFVHYIPFIFIMVYVMAGQFITSANALLGLSIAYISLCVPQEIKNIKSQN